jgi:VanZ family protein
MANSHTFEKVPIINIPNIDKVVHFGMYFGLMSIIILENRKAVKGPYFLLFVAGIALFYGILIEFMQSAFTLTRTGSFYDALADFAGIIVSVILWFWLKPVINR